MSSKNRVPLAVKIAKAVLKEASVTANGEWDRRIVFDDDCVRELSQQIRRLTPATLGNIIAYGAWYGNRERTPMYEGARKDVESKYFSGMDRLRSDAANVIRAAMIDLIKENNNRPMQQHVREVCPEL